MGISYSRPARMQDVIYLFLSFIIIMILWLVPLSGSFVFKGTKYPSMLHDPVTTHRASFADDLEYWKANCQHGAGDATCETIFWRADACNYEQTPYCTAYKSYMNSIFFKGKQSL